MAAKHSPEALFSKMSRVAVHLKWCKIEAKEVKRSSMNPGSDIRVFVPVDPEGSQK